MRPLYVRQTSNDITGEHSCIMLKSVGDHSNALWSGGDWCKQFNLDFQRRFVSLLSYNEFKSFPSPLALNILYLKEQKQLESKSIICEERLKFLLSPYDLKRLELYGKNLTDYHLIMDLVPTLAHLYFNHAVQSLVLSGIQATILLGVGLQRKSIDSVAVELDMPPSQVLAVFCKIIKKCSLLLNDIMSQTAKLEIEQSQQQKSTQSREKDRGVTEDENVEKQSPPLHAPQTEDAADTTQAELKRKYHKKYDIIGTESDWKSALNQSNLKMSISLPRQNAHSPDVTNDTSVIDSILADHKDKGSSKTGKTKRHSYHGKDNDCDKSRDWQPETKKQKKFLSKRS